MSKPSVRWHLAGLRLVLTDLADSLRVHEDGEFGTARDPLAHLEWLQVIEARAARGRVAEAEPLLEGIGGDSPPGSPLRLVVNDLRAAIRRLADFMPELADAADGPDGEWHQVETATSQTRFQLLYADARGHFRRLSELLGQPQQFIRVILNETQARIVRALFAAGPQSADDLADRLGREGDAVSANTVSSAVTKKTGGLRTLGLVSAGLTPARQYQLTEDGKRWAGPDDS